jgi:hypothetical protein
MHLMRDNRQHIVGLIVIALLILAIVVVRFARVLVWSAR